MTEHDVTPLTWFLAPDGPRLPLGEAPLLESWDARTAPSQIRLAGYVERLGSLARPALAGVVAPAAVELIVGRERTAPGDLDNFLTPLARAVGRASGRVDVVSYSALRDRRAESSVRLSQARPCPPPGHGAGWSVASAVTTVSADGSAWKQSVSDQIGRHSAADTDEPLELVICLGVGPQRNWVSLWKPSIDALGGILGLVDTRAWHPRDDRIERLALHRTVDPGLGWSVRVGVWWRPLNEEGRTD